MKGGLHNFYKSDGHEVHTFLPGCNRIYRGGLGSLYCPAQNVPLSTATPTTLELPQLDRVFSSSHLLLFLSRIDDTQPLVAGMHFTDQNDFF